MKKSVLILALLGGSAIMYAQSGNVGIGTTAPASKLTVNGNASVGSGYTGTAAPANGAIVQGKVGIGTNAPTAHLHLADSATGGSLVGTSNPANIAIRFENVNNGQAITQLYTTKNSSGAVKQAVVGINPDWLGKGVYVIGRDGHTNDILVDLVTGHTGMGADPDGSIRINLGDSTGTSDNPIARVSNISPVAVGNQAIIGFNSYNGGGSTWGIGPQQISTNPYDSKFHLNYSNGGGYHKALTILPNNAFMGVGMNNSSPQTQLHVRSSGTGGAAVSNANVANMALRLENPTNGQSVIQHFLAKDGSGGTEEFLFGINPTYAGGNGLFYMGVDGSNDHAIMMEMLTGNIGLGAVPSSTSKVIIGNTNPNVLNLFTSAASMPGGATSGLLVMNKTSAAVSGDVWANFVAGGSTVGWIGSNSATTIAYNTSSDIRLKENIKSTHFGIDDVMKIDVKDYNYKADATKTPQTGFIAQQLYTVFPSAVTKGGEDVTTRPWAVDYGKVTPLLTKAIQDQQKEIEALKAKNAQLEKLASRTEQAEKVCAELAAQVKEMQQMLGISKIAAGSKVASK